MQTTEDDLEIAFNRTHLADEGMTFDQALQCPMIKKCLERMVVTAKQTPQEPVIEPVFVPKPKKAIKEPPGGFWWQKL